MLLEFGGGGWGGGSPGKMNLLRDENIPWIYEGSRAPVQRCGKSFGFPLPRPEEQTAFQITRFKCGKYGFMTICLSKLPGGGNFYSSVLPAV